MMIRLMIVIACLLAWSATAARAQDVTTDLSERDIPIEWDFSGAKILLFGAIDRPEDFAKPADVIIVVRGPQRNLRVREKQNVFGIWLNMRSEIVRDVPGYYSVLSTRPIAEITDQDTLNRLGIGFQAIERSIWAAGAGGLAVDREFGRAVVRIKNRQTLYAERPQGVTLIGRNLFRADINLPANVPAGRFRAAIHIFNDGRLVGIDSAALDIQKQGVERFLYRAATHHPLLYGLGSVLLAVALGLAASALFRRT